MIFPRGVGAWEEKLAGGFPPLPLAWMLPPSGHFFSKMEAKQIIKKAVEKYKTKKALLLFSGGHDSLVSTHVSSFILKELGVDFWVYHGDTGIKIPETQDFVRMICEKYGWPLLIGEIPKFEDTYEEIIKKHGFPGPGIGPHQFMYRRLKERALRHTISHKVKSSQYARENILLISGIRKFESRIRMGYTDYTRKENSKIWCNPIFFWQTADCHKYMAENEIPRNRVKDQIGISGECLCGCFSDQGEFDRIAQCYPHVADEIDRLHQIAIEHGHPWFWTQGPTQWAKLNPPGQLTIEGMGMCVRCANTQTYKKSEP